MLVEPPEQQTEAALNAIFEMVSIGVAQIDPFTARFVRVNQKLALLTGYAVEELLAMTVFDLTHPEDHLTIHLLWETALRDGTPELSFETRYLRKNGATHWVHLFVSILRNREGIPIAIVALIQDSIERTVMGDALRKSQEWQALALDVAKICAWEMDAETMRSVQQDNLARIVGFALPHDFPETIEFIHQEDREPLLAGISSAIETGKPYQVEFRMVNPTNNEIVWLQAQAILVQNSEGTTPRFVGFAQNITDRKRMEEVLQRSHAELENRVLDRTAQLASVNATLRAEATERQRAEAARQHLLHQLVSAQEDERRRIARELHDSLGQHLVALHLRLKSIQAQANCPPNIAESIQKLREQVARIDDDLEYLVFTLRPPILDDLGLEEALRWHVQDWATTNNITLDLHLRGKADERLPSDIETTIYRIVQEALTNIVKHTTARHVSLILERRLTEARVIIEDDGEGFDWNALQHSPPIGRKFGLQGMVERVTMVGGWIDFETAVGFGTTLYVHIPLASEQGQEVATSNA